MCQNNGYMCWRRRSYIMEINFQAMIDILRELTKKSFGCYDSKKSQLQFDRKTWIDQDPAQMALLVNNIMWSVQVEEAYKLQMDI